MTRGELVELVRTYESATEIVDAIVPLIREQVAEEIEAEANRLWERIQSGAFVYYGVTEPGSVDPFLEERHGGLVAALRIARGSK